MKGFFKAALLVAFLLCALAAIAAENARMGIVTADDVILRENPTTESAKLASLEKGTIVTIFSSASTFFKVEHEGKVGYITDQYLVVFPYDVGNINADSVNFRYEASLSSKKQDVLSKGTSVYIHNTMDEFYLVTVGEDSGYIARDFVNVGKAKPVSNSSASSSQKSGNSSSSSISSSDVESYERKVNPPNLGSDDIYLAAKLIYAEGRSQSQVSFEMMATILLNRLQSGKFPKTMEKVVYQPNQFTPALRESFQDLEPSQKALDAVNKVFVQGVAKLPANVMFFKSGSLPREWGSRKYYCTYGGNMYYS